LAFEPPTNAMFTGTSTLSTSTPNRGSESFSMYACTAFGFSLANS